MRSKPVSSEEQYRLVLECRASGLSDYQWCTEHGIKPGTFYNWVKRLRQNGVSDIPAAARGKGGHAIKQEVVKLDLPMPSTNKRRNTAESHGNSDYVDQSVFQCVYPELPVIEVIIAGTAVRIPQGTDSCFIEQVLRQVKAVSC